MSTQETKVAQLRRARRAFVRDQHPDRGGDPGSFHEGLARYDALLHQLAAAEGECAAAPPGGPRVFVTRRPTGVGGWLRHLTGRLDRGRHQHRLVRVR